MQPITRDLSTRKLSPFFLLAAAPIYLTSNLSLFSPRYSSPATPDDQIIDRKLSKYSVTARMANGQITTRTRVVDGSQNNFLTGSQIESTRPPSSKSPPGLCSPSVVGIKPGGGVNASVALASDSMKSRLMVGGCVGGGVQSEMEEADPDVIPNQYGKRRLFLLAD